MLRKFTFFRLVYLSGIFHEALFCTAFQRIIPDTFSPAVVAIQPGKCNFYLVNRFTRAKKRYCYEKECKNS